VNVTLFGLGYVGSVTASCLAARGHSVVGVDTDPYKVVVINAGRSPVIEPGLDDLVAQVVQSGALRATESVRDGLAFSDISVVCVGTPSAANGSTDLVQVTRVVSEIGSALAGSDRPHTVVIRSTVPPGTIEDVVLPLLEVTSRRTVGSDLQIAMCPEFLREGSGVADFFDPPFLVVGGLPAAAAVRKLFEFLDCSVHVVPIRSAESVKYACNAFHALKVSFANELSQLYRLLDVDSRQVMDIFVQDRQLNISPAYLRPGFAFGGSCLPKDLRSLLYLARINCVELPVLEASLTSNEMLVRDVAERILLTVDDAAASGNRGVALLGLSFKHNTDDLRESPNVALAEILIGKGLDVRIYDPVVNMANLEGANLRYMQTLLPHLQKVLHDDAADALCGAHVAVVTSANRDVVDDVVTANPPVVLDLDGRLGASLETLDGYVGVGW
jgi:GDP-mannose 6-dehydrogenase